MRELIRHILKENNLKQELKKVIEDDNIFKAADLVGGMDNLKSIFKDDPEISFLFDKLTGTIIFYYTYIDGGHMKFPLEYEIIGRHSNNYNTNYWPEINVIYDENKLTPEENNTFKSIIKYLYDEAQHSSFKSKFEDSRLFNTFKNVSIFMGLGKNSSTPAFKLLSFASGVTLAENIIIGARSSLPLIML
jgi:hypothetical protein